MEKPYIKLDQDFPGIVSLFMFDHEVASNLTAMGQTIMRRKRGLSVGERELIGAFVSKLNDCHFCRDSHAACAKQYLGNDLVEQVIDECDAEILSMKMRALLTVAVHVQELNREDLPFAIEAAKIVGATDEELWDTILITSFFSMCNRMVDGAGTTYKFGEAEEGGRGLAHYGYQMTARRFFAEVIPRLWNKLWSSW